MKPSVFISYRRDDSDIAAGRLADDLTKIFGSDAVFRDIGSIKAGDNYVRALDDALRSCVALIAVIGARWSSITDDKGNQRLADSKDWVRIEIRTALDRLICVIPVLLSGTILPRETDIPVDLKPLLNCQTVDLRDRTWEQDLEKLAQAIEQKGIIKIKDPIYRALVADLDNLDRALRGLAHYKSSSMRELSLVLAQVHMVEVAADPISKLRERISELGDAGTRKDLDDICTAVEVIRALAEHTEDGVGATVVASVLEDQGKVKKLRERLLPLI